MGVVSNGMLCSGDELGLTGDADGILILPADTPLGRPLTELYGDVVLDVDVKPNRGDALSIVGLAREVAAVTGGAVRLPPTEVDRDGPADRRAPPGRGPRPGPLPAVRRPLGQRRPRRPVAGPGPDAAAGRRPAADQQRRRRLELRDGRARQADPHVRRRRASTTAGSSSAARPRASASRRSTTSSASSTRRRSSSPTRRGPIGIAGVMGGAGSEVGEGTTDVIVESAIFDPVSIRRTAFRYALRSEASLRFEKGQEWRLARLGADRTARLIAEWAGGEVAPGAVDTHPIDPPPPRVAFRPARVDRLLGTDARRPTSSAPCWRGSGSRRRRPRPGTRDRRRRRLEAARRRARRRRGHRRDGPDLAARPAGRGRHHRGDHPGPRLRARPGDACRTRRCRPTGRSAGRPRRCSARRSPAPA